MACRVDTVIFNSSTPRYQRGHPDDPRVVRPRNEVRRLQLINGCDYFPGLPRSPTGGRLQKEAAIRQFRVEWSDHFFAPVAGRVQVPGLLSTGPGQALRLRRPGGPDCPSPHTFPSRSYTRTAASSFCSCFGPPFEQNQNRQRKHSKASLESRAKNQYQMQELDRNGSPGCMKWHGTSGQICPAHPRAIPGPPKPRTLPQLAFIA